MAGRPAYKLVLEVSADDLSDALIAIETFIRDARLYPPYLEDHRGYSATRTARWHYRWQLDTSEDKYKAVEIDGHYSVQDGGGLVIACDDMREASLLAKAYNEGAPDYETACARYPELLEYQDNPPDWWDEDESDLECPHCNDLGGNRYDDRATPCPLCGK